MGKAAENHVVDRITSLPGCKARNANDSRNNQPGFDVLATNAAGHEVRVSVESVSTGGVRHDYAIGRSFERHRADIYTFVDMTDGTPGSVYLAGPSQLKSWPWNDTASTKPTVGVRRR